MLPIKPTVFILLVTQHTAGQVQVAVGPVYWNRIDAHAAMRRFPYDSPDVHVEVAEREVRGQVPVMAAGLQERGNSPEVDR